MTPLFGWALAAQLAFVPVTYLLGPNMSKTCRPSGTVGAHDVVTSSALRASANAFAASSIVPFPIGNDTNTLLVARFPTLTDAEGNTGSWLRPGAGYGQSTMTQPIPIKQKAIWLLMPMISSSIFVKAMAKEVPVNFSSLAHRRFPSSSNLLLALNFSSANAASLARAFASATRPSSASLARFANHNSPQTPPNINRFAPIDAAIFDHPLGMNRTAISTRSPARMRYATLSAQVELKSDTDFKSVLSFGPSIFGYIRPRGRRSNGLIWTAGACTIFTAILFVYAACRAIWG